ncbi:NAD(P)/FAD-dependent oxidoreductase [Actibacterium lipolyticum]|uniref:Gamma-glutamylputrescine oxidoreductase n=1 Tax=Actibacterium lipolyticum TaxID=1524263 RepID=A0A238KKZ9_9RHOB|nr:FAD-binding oxidoreductase [Actibacterium lipolyticum]SMX43485.1 Gamma-glutamylputrescine oxidoreductase [Actibacterium lipolyticum]
MNLLFSNDRRGEYPDSWYAATATLPAPFPELRGETKADVCIIGGGYTGLSAALHLSQRGFDVVLLEAHRVGFGASGRNGGQVGSGQRLEQDALERLVGRDDARTLWQFGEDAKALIAQLIDAHNIDCGYRPGVVHAEWQAKDVPHNHAYADKLRNEYGYDQVEPLDRDAMQALVGSHAYQGGSVDWGAGHLHPLALAFGIATAAARTGARIHEMSHVHNIRHGAKAVVQTDKGRVTADHVILATNGYLGGLERKVASRVMPINNFIVATEPLEDPSRVLAKDVAVADSKFVVNYFRLSADNRLLFGGGESYGYRFPSDIAATVRKPMLEVFPQLKDAKIDYAWGGTLAITMNRLPFFTRPADNMLSASGYSGHGVALAVLAGQIMAEATAGQAERFDVMSRIPTPRFPGGGVLRSPMLALAMSWYAMRDKIGM